MQQTPATQNLGRFFEDCKTLLGETNVRMDAPSDYKENLSRIAREIPGIVFPRGTDDVKKIVALANRDGVALYPISRGRNWGLGSRAPVQSGNVVLDLSRMSSILAVDSDLGVAVVQPGVTQAQLATHLSELRVPWILDVTGSGADTSVIGNSLERGVAYNSHRAESISTMEVVLGDGTVIRTGYAHYEGAKTASVFKYGIGPALDGLFFQSNMGIVTEATVLLRKVPEAEVSFVLPVTDAASIPDLVEALRSLMERDTLRCIPHIFNRERFFPGIAPLFSLEAEKSGLRMSRSEVEAFLSRAFPGNWWAVGSISGDPVVVRRKRKLVTKALGKFGKLSYMTPRKLALIKTGLKLLRARKTFALVNATDCLRGLTRGKPTQATLYSLLWPVTEDFRRWDPLEPDQGPGGFLYCVPVIPLTSRDTRSIVALIEEHVRDFGFNAAISINPVTSRFAEIVASIDFRRADLEATRLAQTCIFEMNRKLFKEGYPPYRMDIESMKLAVSPDDPHWITTARLKQALDPKNVIAPGKYNLV